MGFGWATRKKYTTTAPVRLGVVRDREEAQGYADDYCRAAAPMDGRTVISKHRKVSQRQQIATLPPELEHRLCPLAGHECEPQKRKNTQKRNTL